MERAEHELCLAETDHKHAPHGETPSDKAFFFRFVNMFITKNNVLIKG